MRIYLAFILLMISVGLLDSIALYRAAAHLKADPIYLGIISFIWSSIYIVSSIFFGYLSDRYRVKILGILSAVLLIISTLYILFSQDLLLMSIGYSIHSAATASGRIAVSIDVLENSDKDVWGNINFLLRGVYWVFRAILLYIVIGAGYSPEVAIATAILASMMLTMIQDPLIPSRRFLYRLGDTLDRYYSISFLRGFIISSLLDANSRNTYNKLSRIWSVKMPSPALLAISSALLTASAEMILTPAPSILSSSLGSRGLSYYLVLSPLVPRWLLILICLVLLCFLTHRDAKASLWSSRDFHLPQRDLGISMGSWVAVEPSGTGLPSMLETPKPLWAAPSYRASVSGAPKVIASRSLPRSSRDIASSSKQLWIRCL
ncbi:MAG: hypothetical protein RQ855_00945 [Desulfurococcales archaeon]|nr:hypothetical protein [Desulfurococcales archaeon]